MDRTIGTFSGFPAEAFAFLAGLSRNNRKDWFDAHRGQYDAAVVAPALAFIRAMGAALQPLAPSVVADPRIGGSLFRIHRDTRFSRDKRPYKTHVGIRLRDGDTATSARCTGPLFYVEFDADSLRLGVGVKEFDRSTLAAYRQTAAQAKGAKALGALVARAEAAGCEVLGDRLSRVPPDYAGQPDNDLLTRKGLFVRRESALPAEIHGPEFVRHCERWFRPWTPLFHQLRDIALLAAG